MRVRNRAMAASEVTSEAKPEETKAEVVPEGKAKIYVGKGRYIVDDPAKYPNRTTLTGGFAGGEVGLKQFVSELDEGDKKYKKEEKASNSKASPTNKSKNSLYVGKGRYLPYDPANNEAVIIKTTGRDSNLTGGFSGGEAGLRRFVETGEVPFAPEGSRRKQQSPLIVAGIISASAVTGGLLLNDAGDIGERFISGSTGASPAALAGLDENTKLLLETAVLLVGVVATVVGGRAVVGNLTNNLKEGATRLAVLAMFWVAVFIAARFILDS
ncbi:hypothetical protein Ndes2437B_g01673 [Nannochloris sp. 'desiccata']